MKLSDFCQKIFYGKSFEEKIFFPKSIEFDDFSFSQENFLEPYRWERARFSKKKIKFPKGERLFSNEGKAIALNSFANHELLATEIMAISLLRFPHRTESEIRFKKGILKTLRDEQKHFKLYVDYLAKLGYEFGDFPLSDFFWKWSHLMDTPEKYLSIMSITFEGANLDFAHYFAYLFREQGDEELASILDIVFEDEISHVAFGGQYLNKWRGDKSLWRYYLTHLPFPMTPARAKGIKFYRESRVKAGLDEHFVNDLERYRDDFRVTQRKTWKKSIE